MFACSVALAAAVAEQSGSGARVPAVWGAGPRRLGGADEHLADDVTEGRAWRGLGGGLARFTRGWQEHVREQNSCSSVGRRAGPVSSVPWSSV